MWENLCKKKINKGEKFNEKEPTVKRPGDGICVKLFELLK